MRYVIVSAVKGEAGIFNENLRKEVFNHFGAGSSKLYAHFTIKSPFEYNGSIKDLEEMLFHFSKSNNAEPYNINGFDHFDNRVIFMAVNMSDEAKRVHDKLIEEISSLPYINFQDKDGKDKTFHVTVASKKLSDKFQCVWDYCNSKECSFCCMFDNVRIYKWDINAWKLYREYKFI